VILLWIRLASLTCLLSVAAAVGAVFMAVVVALAASLKTLFIYLPVLTLLSLVLAVQAETGEMPQIPTALANPV